MYLSLVSVFTSYVSFYFRFSSGKGFSIMRALTLHYKMFCLKPTSITSNITSPQQDSLLTKFEKSTLLTLDFILSPIHLIRTSLNMNAHPILSFD